MILNINVFGPPMVHLISTQTYGTLTIIYTTVMSCFNPKLPTKHRSLMASFTTSAAAMYSASVVDSAIVDCNVAFQLIALPERVKIHQ